MFRLAKMQFDRLDLTKLLRSKVFWFAIGLLLYLLLTLVVLTWYQDDADQMTWVDREVFNDKIISQYRLSEHISQQQVLQRLGSPDITMAMLYQQQRYQIMYYRTHRRTADGITTTDECTALLFKDRQLIATADAAVNQYQTLSTNAD